MRLDFQWNRAQQDIINDVTRGNQGKLFLANEAKRLMDPYVPFLNGPLSSQARVSIEQGSGIVHYLSPYAAYQFYGKVMVSDVTGSPWARSGESKHVIDKDLEHNKFRHPLATSHWDKAMLVARSDDLIESLQNYIRRRNGGSE